MRLLNRQVDLVQDRIDGRFGNLHGGARGDEHRGGHNEGGREVSLLSHPVEVWIRGLFAGMIGGGATSGVSWLGMLGAHAAGADVPALNLKALGVIFLSGALTNALAYLKQSPLPPADETPQTIAPPLEPKD